MRNSENYVVSFFDNLKNVFPIYSIDIREILEEIRNGKWKSEIESCRIDLNKKKDLPCFTPSGIFHKRNSSGLEKYTGIICLDIDNVEDPERLKNLCKSIPWIWAAFITPSGKGLKIIVQTIPELNDFPRLEAEVALAFYKYTGFLRDEKCKDLARVQFVSFDQDIYLNQKPEIYK
ncbi:MAG: BT4734/BF3469 family protein [Bacteroidota bacterium]